MNFWIKLLGFIFFTTVMSLELKSQEREVNVDLLVIGGGASGTTAGIQAARMGVETLIIEETQWLGGMLTAAGVSAIDGNHFLPSGLWGEFRGKLYEYYGGAQALATGWVSHTLFEPSIGDRVLKELAKEEGLDVWFDAGWEHIGKKEGYWLVDVLHKGKRKKVNAKLLIDATELGDVLAAVGVDYRIGMNSREETGEVFASKVANDIIQDMTYVVVLKDFGQGKDMTIKKPKGYDPNEFHCAIDVSDPAGDGTPDYSVEKMITYGKLPNDKYMINWPKCGNDIYLNMIEMSKSERAKALEKAKQHTLRFVYYLQTELGYSNLGIARDEFPTKDGFPMIPYHRESRLMKGMAFLTVDHMANPYDQEKSYYRTGIAVGDYPIDHHHDKNIEAPKIDFINIKIPAYNVPIGSLIPEKVDGLVVAEKSISVSNIVNGATRLQPVVLGIGQAAGALAATALKNGIQPREVDIREVQQKLLDYGAYLMPFKDVHPEDVFFESVQRIGATGILKGFGVPYKWANETWFYPNRVLSEYELVEGLKSYYEINRELIHPSGKDLTLGFIAEVLKSIDPDVTFDAVLEKWRSFGLGGQEGPGAVIDRAATAMLIDSLLDPFALGIDFNGHFEKPLGKVITLK